MPKVTLKNGSVHEEEFVKNTVQALNSLDPISLSELIRKCFIGPSYNIWGTTEYMENGGLLESGGHTLKSGVADVVISAVEFNNEEIKQSGLNDYHRNGGMDLTSISKIKNPIATTDKENTFTCRPF